MFEKLLSLLPYNPGLANQMAFYSQRMRAEASIRRIGVFFLVFAFLIQFVAVISPPKATLAAGDNDLVTGGISSRADGKAQCLNDTRGYQRILHYYGISCAKFDTATEHTISTSANNYYSMGHNTSSGADHGVDIDGAGHLYWRALSTWNTASWHVLQLTNNQGKTFYVIYDCANLVTVGIPSQSQLASSEVTTGEGFGNVPVTPGLPPLSGTVPARPADTAPIPPEVPNAPPQTATPSPVTYPCRFNPSIPNTDAACPRACPYNSSIPITNIDQCFCIYNNSIPPTDEKCKPCQKSANAQDTIACIEVSKAASNVTTGVADANNTTAKAGDVITYTLYAKNNGKATVKSFTFQENLSDVLDYASVNDFHGGSIDNSTKIVSWPARDILSNATSSVQITVKVKDPIPQTPASTSDPLHFDLNMNNVYGNAINIKLPGSPAKTIETTAASLPNTGPGTSLFIGGSIVILAGYFYGRARLLAKESNLALKETTTSI